MKLVALISLVTIILASSAQGKDITLTFNDEEQRALIQVLDAATKANGLEQAKVTLYFLNKLQAPQPVPQPPAPAGGGNPAEKK